MFSYTTRNVNIVSFFITCILFLVVYQVIPIAQKVENKEIKKEETGSNVERNIQAEQNSKDNVSNKTTNSVKQNTVSKPKNNEVKTKTNKISYQNSSWKIQIPSISLEAPIASGTSKEVMDQFVGHFEHTSKWEGNVALAAHNRGYPVNYFKRIKELKIGDRIYYYTELGIKEYVVTTSTIISDTDWSYLEPTQDNRITLITCVENVPEKRRCIQAKEIIER